MTESYPKDPDRVATGRIGAYRLHGLYDSKALTRAANAGWLERFKREAREAAEARGEQLSEAELERRAISLRTSYMQSMARERQKRRSQARTKKTANASSNPDIVASAKDELVAALEDVLARVRRDDSPEGLIRWLLPSEKSDDVYEREAAGRFDFMVQARYWVGCAEGGEGQMRLLQRRELPA